MIQYDYTNNREGQCSGVIAMRDDLEEVEEVAGSIPFPSCLLSHITCYLILRDTVNTVAYYIAIAFIASIGLECDVFVCGRFSYDVFTVRAILLLN